MPKKIKSNLHRWILEDERKIDYWHWKHIQMDDRCRWNTNAVTLVILKWSRGWMSSIKSGMDEKCIPDRWEHILIRPWMRSCISSMALRVINVHRGIWDGWKLSFPPPTGLLHRAVHCCGLPRGWFRPYLLVLLLHSMAERSLDDDGTLEDDGERNIEIRVHRPRSAHSFWRDLQHCSWK